MGWAQSGRLAWRERGSRPDMTRRSPPIVEAPAPNSLHFTLTFLRTTEPIPDRVAGPLREQPGSTGMLVVESVVPGGPADGQVGWFGQQGGRGCQPGVGRGRRQAMLCPCSLWRGMAAQPVPTHEVPRHAMPCQGHAIHDAPMPCHGQCSYASPRPAQMLPCAVTLLTCHAAPAMPYLTSGLPPIVWMLHLLLAAGGGRCAGQAEWPDCDRVPHHGGPAGQQW